MKHSNDTIGKRTRDLLACSPILNQLRHQQRAPLRSIQNTQISVRAERGIVLMLNLVVQKVATRLCGVEVLRKQRTEMPVEVLNHYLANFVTKDSVILQESSVSLNMTPCRLGYK